MHNIEVLTCRKEKFRRDDRIEIEKQGRIEERGKRSQKRETFKMGLM